MPILSASCRCDDQLTLFDVVWLERATGAQSHDGCCSEFDQLLKTDGSTWTTDSVRNDSDPGIVKGYIENSILSVPLHFLGIITLSSNLLTPEWVSNGKNNGSDDAEANFEMWCDVLRILLSVLLAVDAFEGVLVVDAGQQLLNVLVELCEHE